MTFNLLRAQSNSCPLAVAILEEFCMASADMQWPICSGERIMAHGPLVYFRPNYISFINADNYYHNKKVARQ